jgi:homoserine acetyltransferase
VWLRDLLDELGVSQATVVGHSLGGDKVVELIEDFIATSDRQDVDSREPSSESAPGSAT